MKRETLLLGTALLLLLTVRAAAQRGEDSSLPSVA